MKPYIAVITDSFREAFASRVLWFVLLGIALFLAALAPVGLRDEVTTRFRRFDVTSGRHLVRLLQTGTQPGTDTPAAKIFHALEPGLQKRLADARDADAPPVRTYELLDALNELLDRDDWYDAELWKSTTRLRELRELDDADGDQLSDALRRRRARLRLESALPGAFQHRSGDSVRLCYAGLDFPDAFVLTQHHFTEALNRIVLPLIVGTLIGVLGVFIAILVTGSIIPEMFQSGSLQLLLSKPVSRSLLFLAKFVGGCWFVTLNITLLTIGLWLIVGLRLHHWNQGLLLCIPLFVFLFMVYYSVSAVSGLIWRNTIVSISVTVVFWIICFLGRVGFSAIDTFVTQPATIQHMAPLGDEMFASTGGGEVVRFDRQQNRWTPVLEADFGSHMRVLGPIALPVSETIIAVQLRGGRFNAFSSSDAVLSLINEDRQWNAIDGVNLPSGTRDMFVVGDRSLIAYGTQGILHADASALDVPSDSDRASGMFANLMAALSPRREGFVKIGPPDLTLNSPMSLCRRANSHDILVYSRGKLLRLQAEPGQASATVNAWTIAGQAELEGELGQRAAIASTSDCIVLAREEDGLEIYDMQSFERKHIVAHDPIASPIDLQGHPNGQGQVAVRFSDNTVKILDARSGTWQSPPIPHQGTISAIGWSNQGQLLIAYQTDRIGRVDLDSNRVVQRWVPEYAMGSWVQDWVVAPLQWVFPKPGELGDTAQGIIVGSREIEAGPSDGVDLDYERHMLQIRQPVISCALFTVFMLSVGCWYVSRQDF